MTRLTLSLPMVRALRAGLKTQTRRVSPPRFKVGDVLAIAEPCTISLCQAPDCVPYLHCEYAAGGAVTLDGDPAEIARCATMPTVINRTLRAARFMPGWAERSKVRITAIQEQALGDITEADAKAEGFTDRAAFLAYMAEIDDRAPIDRRRTLADLTLPVWAIHFEVVT